MRGKRQQFHCGEDCVNYCRANGSKRMRDALKQPSDAKQICGEPVEKGNCLQVKSRFHFNNKTTRCEEFIYSGCGATGTISYTETSVPRSAELLASLARRLPSHRRLLSQLSTLSLQILPASNHLTEVGVVGTSKLSSSVRLLGRVSSSVSPGVGDQKTAFSQPRTV